MWPHFARKIVLIKPLPNERFDDRLPAHIHFLDQMVKFFQHVIRKIYVDAAYRRHHLAAVREVRGYISALISHFGDFFGFWNYFGFRNFLHIASVPLGSIATA